jgi:hypothetical protein
MDFIKNKINKNKINKNKIKNIFKIFFYNDYYKIFWTWTLTNFFTWEELLILFYPTKPTEDLTSRKLVKRYRGLGLSIFYLNKSLYNFNSIKIIKNYFNLLFKSIIYILIPIVVTLLYFYLSLFYIEIEATKQITLWFIVSILFYFLISTFNNFLIKYKYSKFTSAIQRFWRRTGIIFWLIEGFLFILFFYYFLNSSQEPLYMFDYSSLNQELLIQLKVSYKNLILISLSIYFSFILILNNNFLNYYQNFILLIIISINIFYMLYIETYQFVYIISIFSEKQWIFDEDDNFWVLEFEQNNLRVKQHYFILCLIAKYWHFIFIFISWFFFLLKSLENNKINYNLLGYNVQNLIILYFLNLFCLVQWFKILFKKFLEVVYYWFFIEFDEKFFTVISQEILLTLKYLIVSNELNNFYTKIKFLSTLNYSSNYLNLWKYI